MASPEEVLESPVYQDILQHQERWASGVPVAWFVSVMDALQEALRPTPVAADLAICPRCDYPIADHPQYPACPFCT